MEKLKNQAKLLLIEIEEIRSGDFTGRTGDLLALVNEALRSASVLAEHVLAAEDKKDAA